MKEEAIIALKQRFADSNGSRVIWSSVQDGLLGEPSPTQIDVDTTVNRIWDKIKERTHE